ncbi:uncharacterized protein LOC142764934 [Rhipicephalus microplus]|uniref:Putative cystatin-like 1 protein n=1 Tax=Rhipicephalus microplus TaxID=6941 RepID=A0A6M2D1Y9_RHIMP
MFRNLTTLVLLCAAVIGIRRTNFFEDCHDMPQGGPHPGNCYFLTERELRNDDMYRAIAGLTMRRYTYDPPGKFLQTVYGVTRGAFIYSPDMSPKGFYIVEFLTSRSNCSADGPYSPTQCQSTSRWVDGLCQAMFRSSDDGIATHHDSWCTVIH